MSAVIDIAKDIAPSVRDNSWHVDVGVQSPSIVMVRTGAAWPAFCMIFCLSNEEAARVVALARGEK